MAISRAGAPAALAGAVGEDPFGRMLHRRLAAEGVDVGWLGREQGIETPFALVTIGSSGEPSFRIHGSGIEVGVGTLRGREAAIAARAEAVAIGSNTLVGEPARSVSFEIRRAALEAGVPVLFDPNLRPGRWSDLELARSLCRQMAEGATLVKCNVAEARWLLANRELAPNRSAEGVAAIGARLAVITAGPEGAIARGEGSAEAEAEPVEDPRPLGAGDAFMGALTAGLHALDWELQRVGEALPAAVAAGAEACRRLGALD